MCRWSCRGFLPSTLIISERVAMQQELTESRFYIPTHYRLLEKVFFSHFRFMLNWNIMDWSQTLLHGTSHSILQCALLFLNVTGKQEGVFNESYFSVHKKIIEFFSFISVQTLSFTVNAIQQMDVNTHVNTIITSALLSCNSFRSSTFSFWAMISMIWPVLTEPTPVNDHKPS